MKKLSVIIPVYNEEKTVGKLLKKLFSAKLPVEKIEYIIVDDGSIDASVAVISKILSSHSGKRSASRMTFLIKHKRNMGKGAAVKTALQKAKGDYVIIQDADLEYDPKDIAKLLKPIHNGEAQVVYGTRLKRLPNFKRDERTPRFLLQYVGNKFLSLTTSVLYGYWITDMECCYKLFPRVALKNIELRARSFDFEPEITAKLLKLKYKIVEIPISTNPRGYEEGKKLRPLRDGTQALLTLLKYRFVE